MTPHNRWPKISTLERFMKFIKVDSNGCWLWQGFIRKDGYGQFYNENGTPEMAHRSSYRLHHGDLIGKDCVLHKCDVKGCVNPDHLRKGTQQENIQDSVDKGRFTGRPAQMSQEDYAEVKRLLAVKQINGVKLTQDKIADMFGVSKAQISKINMGKIKNAKN